MLPKTGKHYPKWGNIVERKPPPRLPKGCRLCTKLEHGKVYQSGTQPGRDHCRVFGCDYGSRLIWISKEQRGLTQQGGRNAHPTERPLLGEWAGYRSWKRAPSTPARAGGMGLSRYSPRVGVPRLRAPWPGDTLPDTLPDTFNASAGKAQGGTSNTLPDSLPDSLPDTSKPRAGRAGAGIGDSSPDSSGDSSQGRRRNICTRHCAIIRSDQFGDAAQSALTSCDRRT